MTEKVETQNAFLNGYNGGMDSNISLEQLQKCSDNEINIDFSLNNKASLDSDKAVVDKEIQQSGGPGLYRLDNVYNCDCDLKQVKEVQLSQPNVNVMNNGGGWIGQKGCLVDSDSNVRFDLLTNKKFIHQLPTTVNQGFFGKGQFDVDTESIIRSGDLTNDGGRACNVLSGSSTLPYSITPMIEKLEKEVQDPKHIIPEDSIESWLRAGSSIQTNS